MLIFCRWCTFRTHNDISTGEYGGNSFKAFLLSYPEFLETIVIYVDPSKIIPQDDALKKCEHMQFLYQFWLQTSGCIPNTQHEAASFGRRSPKRSMRSSPLVGLFFGETTAVMQLGGELKDVLNRKKQVYLSMNASIINLNDPVPPRNKRKSRHT